MKANVRRWNASALGRYAASGLLALLVVSPLLAAPGAVIRYEGVLAPASDEGAGKIFQLFWLELPDQLGQAYVLEEVGREGWDWSRRFHFPQPEVARRLPSLSYEHETGEYQIPLPATLYPEAATWNAETQWESGKIRYRTAGQEVRADRTCWKVIGEAANGPRQTLWIEAATGILVEADAVVFMGRGERHQLSMQRQASAEVDPGDLAAVTKQLEQLQLLVHDLGPRDDDAARPWNAKQLSVLAERLPKLEQTASWPPVKRLLADAEADLQQRSQQSSNLDRLAEKALGQNAKQLQFATAQGALVGLEKLRKPVTVLHFWDYRDTPLQQPFGQVGYLDFLSRQRAGMDVAVIGVVVNSRWESEEGRRQIVRSARKFSEFMNLSYPLVFDDGGALAQVGDPRKAGAGLPLFVVIDAEGKIASYHAGNYNVHRDRGLEELDAKIAEILATE